jgi:serine/threonine-protein kinase HipA
MTLQVWVNDTKVGTLDRHGSGTTFVYDQGVDPADAISLNMPVRTASYDHPYGLLPVFDTNMPEGLLLDNLRRDISKAYGRADAYDILSETGKNQIGRIRVLKIGEKPQRRPSIPSIQDVLEAEATETFVTDMFKKYGLRSGVSGAMPKVLLEEEVDSFFDPEDQRITFETRDYILKFDAADYPGLSLNEYHCLKVARLAGNKTADCHLGKHGRTLAVRRFDNLDGHRHGFEDLASLNVKTSVEKYSGSMERTLFGTIKRISGENVKQNLEELYRQIVTSIALRNGDAHLKNYAVLFDDAEKGPFTLAPAYDIVTTKAYIASEMMAATYGGSKRWPKPKAVELMAIRAMLTAAQAKTIISEVGAAVKETMPAMIEDFKRYDMLDVGLRIAACWNEGLTASLGMDPVDLDHLVVIDRPDGDHDHGISPS